MIVITTIDALPDYCYECPCYNGESGYCQADKERRCSDYRPYWCPLNEIHENVLQKMWNALYAEEDRLEKKFIGTDKHDDWFIVYRPWLQNGFEIGLKVIAGMYERKGGRR